MAIAWVLRDPRITRALIGASSVAQLEQNVAALERADFDPAELEEIDQYAGDGGINLWATVEQRAADGLASRSMTPLRAERSDRT